jgi:hypothetical protein
MRRFELFNVEELALLGVAIATVGKEDFPEIRPLLTELNSELDLRKEPDEPVRS